jgi:hypothetical protein
MTLIILFVGTDIVSAKSVVGEMNILLSMRQGIYWIGHRLEEALDLSTLKCLLFFIAYTRNVDKI